jgi:ankyrin repeat protein
VRRACARCEPIRVVPTRGQDFNGDTPLHDAVKFGHAAVAKLLVKARARPEYVPVR